jgi:hypothetical protein
VFGGERVPAVEPSGFSRVAAYPQHVVYEAHVELPLKRVQSTAVAAMTGKPGANVHPALFLVEVRNRDPGVAAHAGVRMAAQATKAGAAVTRECVRRQ